MFLSEILPLQLQEIVQMCPTAPVKDLIDWQSPPDESDDGFVAKLEASAKAQIGPVEMEIGVRYGHDVQQRALTLKPALRLSTTSKSLKQTGRGRWAVVL